MTSMPPDNQDPEDIDARYRQLSAVDGARPHPAVSAAVLANAARLAAERASGVRSEIRPRAVYGWRAPLFGGMAAAALAGFLIIPRFAQPDRALVVSPAQPAAPPITPSAPSPAPVVPLAESQAAKSTARAAAKFAGHEHQELKPYADAARAPAVDRGAALRQSADSGDLPGLKAGLDDKVSIDSRDSSGRTALLLAVLSGRDAVVAALLARGADPNISDVYGETPLHAAIAADRAEMAQALRRAGAR